MTAKLKPETHIDQILNAIFPCGSITGAPKVRAMEIISDLEKSPRGVYCGAIGHLSPDGSAAFNVAIRTLTLKETSPDLWTGRVGVGGGVVFDSTPEGEYEECQIKLGFLHRKPGKPLSLIETMRREEDGHIPRLERHLARLCGSARFFDIPHNEDEIRSALDRKAENLGKGLWRLRLTVGAGGQIDVTALPLQHPEDGPARIALSSERTNSQDTFLFHKTTRRTLYDQAFQQAQEQGLADVIFCNERGELTEGTISTLFIERGGILLTPALHCGLLPGVLRAELLDRGEIQEAILTPKDLAAADHLWIGNSLRGMRQAHLI